MDLVNLGLILVTQTAFQFEGQHFMKKKKERSESTRVLALLC